MVICQAIIRRLTGIVIDKPLTDRTRQLIELIGNTAIQEEIKELFENDGALYGLPTSRGDGARLVSLCLGSGNRNDVHSYLRSDIEADLVICVKVCVIHFVDFQRFDLPPA